MDYRWADFSRLQRNVTSLSNRFEGLSIAYHAYRPRSYHVSGVALSFINAMKLGALDDCNERLTRYTFTDTEYQDSDIRIRMTALEDAPQEQLVRCNILYAIKTITVEQLNYAEHLGAVFVESHRGIHLYSGILDNKYDDSSLEQFSNSSADLSDINSQEKRASSAEVLDRTNSTTTLLNITGSNDVEYRVDFHLTGRMINQVSIFSAILEFMMTLAQRDSDAAVEYISQATSTDAYWIFVQRIRSSSFSLQVFEVLAILEGIARHCVIQRHYEELSFHFFIDRQLTAHGCLIAPIASRRWCQGMR